MDTIVIYPLEGNNEIFIPDFYLNMVKGTEFKCFVCKLLDESDWVFYKIHLN